MEDFASTSEVPMGLGMALAQNLEAMSYFSSLSKEEQQKIMNHVHSIRSREEMQAFVGSLADRGGAAQ